jgi:DNA-binding SARP family transcriptional activator/tetratricopeptide (TPR) repeat protein
MNQPGGAVDIRLLGGEVTVRVGGRDVDIGHARQRCVLAVLARDANRVVPAALLLERVWADRPPQRARNALSSYVSRLRQAFAPFDGVAVTRRFGGYALDVDPMAVDVNRFEDLVARAGAAAPGEAVLLLDRALGLWGGEALAGLDTPWAAGTRVTLAARRLTAELDHADVALRLGRHASLLDGVVARAAAHPLNERAAGQAMLALYRCGRQADALHHYERLRRALAGEVGADPCADVRQLHHRILTTDPALMVAERGDPGAEPVADGTAPVVPRQLPPPPRLFAGRAAEIAALEAMLESTANPGATTVAVSGTAGVGKTALAVHWAHRVADRFPDGQLYVDLRGFGRDDAVATPTEAVRELLTALGIAPKRIPAGLAAQTGLYRSLLVGKRILIVLDNARDADQVRPLLPGAAGCMVLVTCRTELTGLLAVECAHPLTLGLLPADDARDLLARRIGAGRVDAEPDAVDDIITRCARLPVSLAIVAARAATRPLFPLRALADELAGAAHDLDVFADGDPATDVRAVFSWSYRTLSDTGARLFRLLGLGPGRHVTVAAAASLAGLPPPRTRRLLAELARAHLVDEDAPGRYSCHDLLSGYARQLAASIDGDAGCAAAAHRVLDHYLHSAYAAAIRLHPYRDRITLAAPRDGVVVEAPADAEQALAWFAAEHHTLLAAVDRAAGGAPSAALSIHAWQLTWAMWTYLDRRGHWHDMLAVGASALACAERLGDPTARVLSHRFLACPNVRLRRYEDAHAHLHHALVLCRTAGDRTGAAHCHNNLASTYELMGRYGRAIEHARDSLALYRAAGHERGAAHGLNTVGWNDALLGHHHRALDVCGEALAHLERLEDLAGQAVTWHSLGYAHHHLDRYKRALGCYQRALDLSRRIGDRSLEADTLVRIGDVHQATGAAEAARRARRHASAILRDLDQSHPAAAA